MWESVPTTTPRAVILVKHACSTSERAAGHSFVVVSDTLVNITAQWVSGRRPHLGRDLFHPHTIVVRFVVVKASCDQCESETSDIIFVRLLIEEAMVGHVGPMDSSGILRFCFIELSRYLTRYAIAFSTCLCDMPCASSSTDITTVAGPSLRARPSLRTRQAVTQAVTTVTAIFTADTAR